MPNHVHLLFCPLVDATGQKIIGSIKEYTSYRINRLLDRKGSLWMRESFDRIVRNPSLLHHYIEYIKANPRGIPPVDYELYIKAM